MQPRRISEGIRKIEAPPARRGALGSLNRYLTTQTLSSDVLTNAQNRRPDCVSSHGILGDCIRVQVQSFGNSRQNRKSGSKRLPQQI